MLDRNFALKQSLSSHELQLLQSEFEKRKKSPVVTWLLWLFLGAFGAHRFYLGQKGRGIAMIIATILIVGIFWALFDAFAIPGALRRANEDIELEVLQQIKAMSPRPVGGEAGATLNM
jgi:TM2 domain-containing membrane protein YozV